MDKGITRKITWKFLKVFSDLLGKNRTKYKYMNTMQGDIKKISMYKFAKTAVTKIDGYY